MTRLALALLIAFGLTLVPGAGVASAFDVAVQDQGADPDVVTYVANQLGAHTVRIVAAPADPQTDLVRKYRAAGLAVQAAIVVKRDTTPGQIRSVMRAWHGQVRTVSIGNEPELNGLSACQYARLFARSSALIRREYPGTTVGFGEFSPATREYVLRVARCHVRIRAAFTGVHAYQFFSDPLAPPTEKSGIGSWIGLGNLASFKRALRKQHLPSRVRVTEFSYLVTGPYRVSMDQATRLWPRAITQAKRHAEQLVIYGLGRVHDSSTWGSAALLDRYGRGTSAMRALATALGRQWVDTVPPPVPAGDLVGALPDGNDQRPQALPPVVLTSKPLVDIAPATGASVDDPTVVPAPADPVAPVGNAGDGTDAPDLSSPATDGPGAVADGPTAPAPVNSDTQETQA